MRTTARQVYMAKGAFEDGKLGVTIQHLARSRAVGCCSASTGAAACAAAARCATRLRALRLSGASGWTDAHRRCTPGRADEISSASGMAELSLLTSEALAYVHALSGDFSKEANYRAQCAQASAALQENSPGRETDLTLFDCLHK